jgi:hypothetical protein
VATRLGQMYTNHRGKRSFQCLDITAFLLSSPTLLIVPTTSTTVPAILASIGVLVAVHALPQAQTTVRLCRATMPRGEPADHLVEQHRWRSLGLRPSGDPAGLYQLEFGASRTVSVHSQRHAGVTIGISLNQLPRAWRHGCSDASSR